MLHLGTLCLTKAVSTMVGRATSRSHRWQLGEHRESPLSQHGIEPSTLRQHAEKTPGLATIYKRPSATTKKHEWWLEPSQKSALLQYWQAQNKAWTPCPDCPHEMGSHENEGITMGKAETAGTVT